MSERHVEDKGIRKGAEVKCEKENQGRNPALPPLMWFCCLIQVNLRFDSSHLMLMLNCLCASLFVCFDTCIFTCPPWINFKFSHYDSVTYNWLHSQISDSNKSNIFYRNYWSELLRFGWWGLTCLTISSLSRGRKLRDSPLASRM